jgi:hypothetical protein
MVLLQQRGFNDYLKKRLLLFRCEWVSNLGTQYTQTVFTINNVNKFISRILYYFFRCSSYHLSTMLVAQHLYQPTHQH